MLLRSATLLITLFISACATNQHIKSADEFDRIKNNDAVKVHLKTADAHYAELRNLKAHTLFPAEFNDIQIQFSQLIERLDKKEVQEAIRQEPALIEEMIQLEIDTLKKIHLDESIAYIKKAQHLDAESYSPSLLEKAETLLSSTQSLIEKSYRDRSTILAQAEKTLNTAKKLYFVAKETNAIHTDSNEAIEQKVLGHYQFLESLQAALKLKPAEIKDYASQQNELIKQVKEAHILSEQAKRPPEIKATQTDVPVQQEPPEKPAVIISQETNKAVLPELFMPNYYSDKNEQSDESLEFDDVEIVK